MIFRIDDVSLNTDPGDLRAIVGAIRERVPGAKIWLAVSPLVHDVSGEAPADRGRAFPRVLSAMSDHRWFYGVSRAGIPEGVRELADVIASHGLVHVDHRLLGREAQEVSIVTSCALVGAKTFAPPFNKWNADTVDICDEHEIRLVRFEDGWRHVKWNTFDPKHKFYYMHTHDMTVEWFTRWLAAGNAEAVA